MNMKAEQVEEINAEAQAAIDKANGNVSGKSVENTEENPDASMWSDFDQELDVDDDASLEPEVSEEELSSTPPAPELGDEEESAPATPPAEEPKVPESTVVETPPAEPPAAEVATPQQIPPQEPVVPQTPPEPQLTPEELQKRQRETRAKAIEEMAKSYSLSEEDATAFLTDPASVVPTFRAEMFLDVFDATMKGVLQAMPALIKQVQQQEIAHNKQEDAFYAANPLLDKNVHGEMVNRFANAYVKAVPNATPEQVIRDVGVQVMFAAGIDPSKANVSAPAAAQTPVTPPPAYVPPGAGASTAGAIPKPETNMWSEIAEDLDEDD